MAAMERSVRRITAGTIYVTPRETMRDGVIEIDRGRIAAVRQRTESDRAADGTLDCSEATITAGFWNSHVHFFERKWMNAASIPAAEATTQLETMLTRFGFTTVFDLGSPLANTHALRDRIASGEVRGPRILTTGEGIVPTGGMPSETVVNFMGLMPFPAPEITTAVEGRAAAQKLIDAGADGVKIFVSAQRGAALGGDVIAAIADVAHRAGKPLFAHPNRGDDVLVALRAGVDVIAHTTPFSGPWSDELIASISPRVALTPTLMLWRSFMRHDRDATQRKIIDTELAQLRSWISARGSVLFGADLGAVEPDPAEELALMKEAGMSVAEILESLTTTPASRFGIDARIKPGAAADFVVLNDSDDLTSVRYTIRGGVVMYAHS